MTFASGVTALLESVIRPVTEAFDDCAATERAEKIIIVTIVMMRVTASNRGMEFRRESTGISGRASMGAAALPATAEELVTNSRRSISPKPPEEHGKVPQ